MKKIQCEVCGSTEIRKISDDVFECQSCGIQYSKNDVSKLLVEITGEVKIDHAKDIENLTIRAERFYEDGDKERAIEYYERVLDADPDNENAQNRINEIIKEQELETAFETVYVFEANTTKEECVDKFFRSLQSQKNIVHDIYKEIRIDDVTEMYYPFSFLKANGTMDWSAIRCDQYLENETAYKDKYNSDTKKMEKVPYTKQVVKVNRVPISGHENWNSSRLVLSSNTMDNMIKCGNVAKSIISNIEKRLDDNYSSENLVKLEAKMLEDSSEAAYYKGIRIDAHIDSELVKSKMQSMLNSAQNSTEYRAEHSAGGSYVENMNSRFLVNQNTCVSIFIPICIINYTYKDQKFSAVLNMFQNNASIEMICPVEKVLTDKDKEVEELTTKINKHGHTTGFVVGTLIFGFISMGIAAIFNSGVFGVIAIVFWIIGLIDFFVDRAQGKKLSEKKQDIEDEAIKNLIEPRKAYLEKTAARFINGYSSYENLVSLQEALPKSDIEIPEVLCSECITVSSAKSKKYINSEDEANMKEIRKLAFENKIEAIKKYQEVFNADLKEAKEAVDKMLV